MICDKCELDKLDDEFYSYDYRTLKTCKDCWNGGHMTKHKERVIWMRSFKEAPCTDCGGIFPPPAMEWDHVRGIKYKAVAAMLLHSKDKILAEIAKCDLVCANCHRMRTHFQRERKEIDYRTKATKERQAKALQS